MRQTSSQATKAINSVLFARIRKSLSHLLLSSSRSRTATARILLHLDQIVNRYTRVNIFVAPVPVTQRNTTSAARENVSCHFFLIIWRPEGQGVALASTLQLVHYSAVSAVAAMSQLRRMDAARDHLDVYGDESAVPFSITTPRSESDRRGTDYQILLAAIIYRLTPSNPSGSLPAFSALALALASFSLRSLSASGSSS